MAKFHINPATGDVASCSATKGKCPFGASADHYSSAEAGRKAFEDAQESLVKITKAEETAGPKQYDFLEVKLPLAVKAIDRANRRLEKTNLTERFSYETENYHAPVIANGSPTGLFERRVKLTVNTPAIKFEGYTFLAAVEKVEAGVVVRQATGVNLYGYSPDNLTCDSCGKAMLRQKTYLVEAQDGKMLQVGSSCVKKYFGVQPEGLWALSHDPMEKATEADSWSSPVSIASSEMPTENVLAYALAASNGGRDFASKSFAQASGMISTVEQIQTALSRKDDDALELAQKAQTYVENGEAKKLIEKLKAGSHSNDYTRNLAVIATGEYTRWRDMAILVSGVSQLESEAEEEKPPLWPAPASGYAAEIKESVAGLKLKVKNVAHTVQDNPYSSYGGPMTTSRITFRDDKNHEIIWWSSKMIEVEENQEVTVKSGSVKNHSQFRGVDQTVLTRVKLEENQ